MHTHAGRANRAGPVDLAAFATLRPSGIGAAVVSAIADLPLLRRDPVTRRLVLTREPEPGECLEAVDAYLASYEATGLRIAREPAEIRPDDPALVLAVEGCDFLDGELDRLDTVAARGVRSIQLTHYRVNETGDIQTAPPVHGGLTVFGTRAVRRMNRLGIMVDVAHCSEATVQGVVAASDRPILCTHANLLEPGHKDGAHPRYISPDYARMVAGTGGVIGGWIAVLHEEKLPGMIRHILRLVDAVGIDHVGIGTDLPSGSQWHGMADFARHGEIPGLLRAAGLSAEETAKVCAGNWLRVFRAVRA
ncbi:MAG: dipeptidase [Acetobacteraceae bacterium]